MVKNLPSNVGDMGLIPGQGTKIPHALGQLSLCTARKTQCSQNKEIIFKKGAHFPIRPFITHIESEV